MAKSGVSAYAAVNARTRAMYSTLLTPEVWGRLYDAADVPSLLDALKETVYGPYLRAVEGRLLTPRRAVYQIKGRLADAYISVIGMLSGPARALLTQLYRIFEVDNLKAVLRGIATGASWDQVRYVLFPLGSFAVIPAQEMVEAESISAAVDLLRGTPYYGTLAHALERYTAEQSLFPLEVALDLDYWRTLWSDISRLSGRDREAAMRVVGSWLDATNLMWAIRYRVYHHLSEEEIINYTLPYGYRVRDADVRAIAAGADVAQVVARAYPDLGNVEPLIQEPRRGLPELEILLQRRLVRQCHSAFLGYPFHVGIPAAYVLLNELEIQDLTVLIEAKAMRMSPDEFQPYLVMQSVHV